STGERHLKPIKNPGDAQRGNDERVEAPPWKAIEPRRDVRFHDRIVGSSVCQGLRSRIISLFPHQYLHRAALSLFESERSRDIFERFTFGRNAPLVFDQCSRNHRCRAYNKAQLKASRFLPDESGKEEWTEGADAGTDGKEESNRESSNLEREYLTCREVGGTCGGRSKKENNHPRQGLSQSRKGADRE